LPSKEDIEKFKEVLNSLGGEPEVMERKGQPIEDVPPPEPPLADDMSDLLAATAAETTPAAPAPEVPPAPPSEPSAEPAPDFELDLSGLGEMGAGPGAEEAPAQPELPVEAGEAPTEEAGLDFGSLFGEESPGQPIEDLEPPPPPEGGVPEPEAPPTDEFAMPESEASALQADLSQMEVLPEDIGEPAIPSAEAPQEPGPSEEPFQGELPSEEALAGIELPNLDDLSLTEPLAEAPPEEPQAEPAVGAGPEGPLAEPSLEPETESGFPTEGLDLGLGVPEEEAAAPPLETPEEPGGAQAPSPAPTDQELANLNLDEFSFAEPAGVVEEKPEAGAGPAKPPKRPREEPVPGPSEEAGPIPEAGAAQPEIALTQEQFNRLKKTLESLPRNLKIAVQDVIAEGKATGASLTRLVSLLVAGATSQQIATAVARVTGKRIAVPAGYEKKTGVAFEEEQRSFAYALRENIYPLVRVFALTILAAALIGFLGYRLVYRPLLATVNYRIGYTHILGDRFTLANESFAKARTLQRIKKWYYRYAEAFSDKRQYLLAEQKYDLLLQDFPGDRKGLLDYAGMESTKLNDYKKADDLLARLLDKDPYDYDALLAAGDNNLEWAASVRAKFEAARIDYATLIEKYGARDDLLFRMLRWFIRTDNPQEIERLRAYFASRPDVRVNPDVYAELGGYLIDHRQLDYAKDVLLKADEANPRLASIHYNLARYYRLTHRPEDELTALNATLLRLRPTDPLTAQRIAMEIDTHTRLGELDNVKGEYIDAERELTTAIAKVEESQKDKLVPTASLFGRPYADLGDLHYYVIGDLDIARGLYQKAIDNQYFDPSLDYKIGFTEYANKDYAAALASFSKAEEEWGYPRDRDAPPPMVASGMGDVDYTGKAPRNLLFAIGNCFFQRGDFFAAQGYYLRLRDRLLAHRAAIGTLDPGEKPEHRSLLETLVKVDNNLGVVMDRLAARTGDRNKKSEGLVYLAEASETADTLTRAPGGPSPSAPSPSGARNLPFLNQRGILYPVSGFVPQISSDIPKDLGTLFW